MPTRYTLRLQFGPHQDSGLITEQLLDLAKTAGVDEILFFFFSEELNDGHETLEQVQEWIDASRPYRNALVEAGVTVSVNPWHTLLHCDRHRKLKPGQDWQTMVDPSGNVCSVTVCPLDPHWQAYFAETLRMYIKEEFRVVWIDDDFRFHNHPPLEWGGCFCPLHVQAFNRRVDVQATRQEIVAACTAPGQPHPWREIWLDMWDETQLELLARWRRIVEAAGCRLGLMSSPPDWHAAEGRRWKQWWKALAGEKPPIHRPGFWSLNIMKPQDLAEWVFALDLNRSLQPTEVESGPEIECFPYGQWNKDFRQLFTQISVALTLGSSNLGISVYDFMGNQPDDEPERAEFLRRSRPAFDWLADTFPMSLRSVGVGLPWSEDTGRTLHTDSAGKWQSLECKAGGWAQRLGAIGHAFSARPSQSVNALAGPSVWAASDKQLRAWFTGGLLLDGLAAHILVQRGFGHLLGVREARLITQADLLYSVEHCLDGAFGLRPGAQISVNDKPYAAQLFQGDWLDGARIVSDLRDPRQKIVGHGLVLFENELGGRVAIAPWSVGNDEFFMNVQRAAQLTKTLAYLDPGSAYGRVEGGPWLVPQFLTDGRQWRGVIWNAGPDELDHFTVHLPAAMPPPCCVTQMDVRGQRFDGTIDGKDIRLTRPLYQGELVVLA